MSNRRVYDESLDAHFVTFSCYKRRRYLDLDRAKQAVMGTLDAQLRRREAFCVGFVVMPNHVHLIVWFSQPNQLSAFLDVWKTEAAKSLKNVLTQFAPHYLASLPDDSHIWQARFYDFNIFTDRKLEEKLNYMHDNPVRWGLVQRAVDWKWSSARHYIGGRPVGVKLQVPPGVM